MSTQLKTGSYISLNPMFRSLSAEQVVEFRQYARDTYTPFEKINELWHPVCRDECEIINEEQSLTNTQYTEDLEANYYDINFIQGVR